MNILILGGDKRFQYVADYLSSYADVKTASDETILNETEKYDCLVLGLPASRDKKTINAPFLSTAIPINDIPKFVRNGGILTGGLIGSEIKKICRDNNIAAEDYYEDETIVIKNAVPSAEGALALGINMTPRCIRDTKVLVTGYGRIAPLLAKYLIALGADVSIAARSRERRLLAKLDGCTAFSFAELENHMNEFALVFGTVPSVVLRRNEVMKMSSDAIYIELASSSGIDIDAAAEKHISIINAPGLPAKTAVKTAGDIIAESIVGTLEKYSLLTQRTEV